MKKVKVMLTAIAVFAVVGGALAFKAQKFGATVYTSTDGANCSIPLVNETIIEQPNANSFQTFATDAANSNQPCAETTVYELR